jgi:23S rRNA (adenine2503-C2)-methyltransferase
MDKDLKNKTLEELERIVQEFGGQKYFADYIFAFVHLNNTSDISKITPLSKTFRNKLAEKGYYISQLNIVQKLVGSDGTIKYLFKLADGNYVESVLLSDRGRKTLCISTQVGCAMNCTFCATGKLKFNRNLTAGEIADQVNSIWQDSGKISNVVYMGMGEPLNNYEAVLKSVLILNHPKGKNLGIRHLTISTCGIAPAIIRLADEDVHPRLAVSLNAPTDSIRTRLMPINAKYPLNRLLDAINIYQSKTGMRVTFEYVLIKGVNDTVLHAQMLVKKLRNIKCNVNLIEYNPHAGCKFAGSDKDAIKRFARTLSQAGIETVVRARMGGEIKAACGQLGADWANGSPPHQP